MTEDKTIPERLRRLSQIASNNQDRIREGEQAYLQDLQEIAAGCGNLARELEEARSGGLE